MAFSVRASARWCDPGARCRATAHPPMTLRPPPPDRSACLRSARQGGDVKADGPGRAGIGGTGHGRSGPCQHRHVVQIKRSPADASAGRGPVSPSDHQRTRAGRRGRTRLRVQSGCMTAAIPGAPDPLRGPRHPPAFVFSAGLVAPGGALTFGSGGLCGLVPGVRLDRPSVGTALPVRDSDAGAGWGRRCWWVGLDDAGTSVGVSLPWR